LPEAQVLVKAPVKALVLSLSLSSLTLMYLGFRLHLPALATARALARRYATPGRPRQSSSLAALVKSGRLHFNNEVEAALRSRSGVLALESAIITNGLPYPDNLETALELEQIARSHGVTPAHIAVLDGSIHIGLSHDQIVRLSKSKQVVKLSRRDLPVALSQQLTGGTTCAATMFIAHLCGIEVFATGGWCIP
jgi:hypothetical protein